MNRAEYSPDYNPGASAYEVMLLILMSPRLVEGTFGTSHNESQYHGPNNREEYHEKNCEQRRAFHVDKPVIAKPFVTINMVLNQEIL